MKIYKIYQEDNNEYDTYDSAVVFAEDEFEALNMHPRGGFIDEMDKKDFWYLRDWSKDVKVRYLGNAPEGTEQGVICSSFNAG